MDSYSLRRVRKFGQHLKQQQSGGCPFAVAAVERSLTAAKKKAPVKKKKSPIIREEELDDTFVEPTVLDLPDGVLFPTFPSMLEDWKRLGNPAMFTYNIAGGRRMTIVTDPELYKVIFFPDKEHLTSNQEVLAYQWFGIEKELSMDYTRSGLDNVRKALKQSKAKGINDVVGKGIMKQFEKFGKEGVADLMDFAFLTFWPVNEGMFSAESVSPSVCPHIYEELETYNNKFELVANGMPRKMFPEMEQAAQNISNHFGQCIDKGVSLGSVGEARLSAIKEDDNRWNSYHKGRFLLSIFWAAQANTLPGTFWALVMVLNTPRVLEKVIEEARTAPFENEDGTYDTKKLKYINAVVQEILRLKVANITHRKAQKPFGLRTQRQNYKLPKGDTLTVCSYLQHHDEGTYENSNEFRPERFLEGKKYGTRFMPFGGGPNTCSGKFLALQEIAISLALFFKYFDATLEEPGVPEEEWDNVVAMVTPKNTCKVKYTRRDI